MTDPGGLAVDPSRLESLRQVDPSLVAEIASLWLDTTPALLVSLTDTTSAAPAIEAAAHSLRGSSANLGADALAEACSGVELTVRRGELAALPGLIAAVKAQYLRAAAEFAELAGRPIPISLPLP